MSPLKEQIIGSYDEVMQDYLESENTKEADWAANKKYFEFRKKLDLELRQEFDQMLSIYEEIAQTEKVEAYYRGVMTGIAERDNFR